MKLDKQQITTILARFDAWSVEHDELAEASGSLATMPSDQAYQANDDQALDLVADLAAAVRSLIPETPRTFVVQRGRKSGKIKHLICPYCQARDTLAEVDVSERWNELCVEDDGTVSATLNDNDFQGTGEFVCQADLSPIKPGFCLQRSTAPEGFAINSWD